MDGITLSHRFARKALGLAALAAMLAGCAGSQGGRPRSLEAAVKTGRWLSAGERLHKRLAERPDDAEASRLLTELESKVRQDAENITKEHDS